MIAPTEKEFCALVLITADAKAQFALGGRTIAEDMLRELHVDILFLGVDGFNTRLGLTTPNILESRVNRAMIHGCRKVLAVCDHTKFKRKSLSLITEPTAVHHVITDNRLPPPRRQP